MLVEDRSIDEKTRWNDDCPYVSEEQEQDEMEHMHALMVLRESRFCVLLLLSIYFRDMISDTYLHVVETSFRSRA